MYVEVAVFVSSCRGVRCSFCLLQHRRVGTAVIAWHFFLTSCAGCSWSGLESARLFAFSPSFLPPFLFLSSHFGSHHDRSPPLQPRPPPTTHHSPPTQPPGSSPQVLRCLTREELESKLGWLQKELDLDGPSLGRVVSSAPGVLKLSVEASIKPKLGWMRDTLGLDRRATAKLVASVPSLLFIQADTLDKKLAFLRGEEVNLSKVRVYVGVCVTSRRNRTRFTPGKILCEPQGPKRREERGGDGPLQGACICAFEVAGTAADYS